MKSSTAAPIVRPFTGRSLLLVASLFSLAVLVIKESWNGMPRIVRYFMAPNTITLVQATYGGRCGARDVAGILAERCEGRPSCDIALDPAIFDQAIRACPNKLFVSWICGRNGRDLKLEFADPERTTSIACAAGAREVDR